MKAHCRFLLCVLALAFGVAIAQPPAQNATEVERLVKQLSSDRFTERETAFKALDALGSAALPALRTAAAKSADSEVRRRVGDLIAKYERQADSADAFAPTKVRLKADKTPLADVVRDLSKQAKIRLQLAREPADLPGRPVTLDTGETSFWEALDALCRQAKVSIRPGAFDPTGADDNLGQGLPAGVAAIAITAIRTDDLVLQDGAPPAYPTAYLGAVRLRLAPDLWGNRTKAPGDEHRWNLEVLSEPKINWQGAPGFQFDANQLMAARSGAAEGANVAMAGMALPMMQGGARVVMNGVGGLPRIVGPDSAGLARPVSRHDLPVYVKAESAAGKTVPELKGTLAGAVNLASQKIAAIADVLKADAATTTAPDNTKLTVRDCQVAADGTVTLKVDVERPAAAGLIGVGNMAGVRQFQFGGAMPGNLAQILNGVDGESLRLFDTQDRPYSAAVTESSSNNTNGVSVTTSTLSCAPAAQGAQPRRLELHGPRRVSVEAKFTLRDVPRP